MPVIRNKAPVLLYENPRPSTDPLVHVAPDNLRVRYVKCKLIKKCRYVNKCLQISPVVTLLQTATL